MKYFILQALCKEFVINDNNTTTGNSSSYGILHDCKPMDTLSEPVLVNIVDFEKDAENDTNSGAVMYIVAVLVFYSAGIMIMIIKYLRTETRELEEERILDDFFRTMPACKKEREQDNVNRVAIHAFHALTSINDENSDNGDVSESIVTYVDTIKETGDGQTAIQPRVDTDKAESTTAFDT